MFNYLFNLSTKLAQKKSLTGAALLICITLQCISGIMISFSYISEPMLVPIVRNEEDHEDLYTDEFFWIHERLVDIIFILMYVHMYKKLTYTVFSSKQITAWATGATLWLLLHGSIFLGLCLCCTHLSDITLTIASNIVYTICMKFGKVYWIIFTNQTLNSDTLIRLSYAHYIVSLITLFFSFYHGYEMHYDWKNIVLSDNIQFEFSWLFYIFKNELSWFFEILTIIYVLFTFIYTYNETLSYEIFMWGDIGINNDIRFLGVAPHWYFRSYMGWLLVCPHHYVGIFGLILFIIIIYFQIYLKKNYNDYINQKSLNINVIENNIFITILNFIFLLAIFYTSSILPYGRFYNRLEGNSILLLSYLFIFLFLTKTIQKIFVNIYYYVKIELKLIN